MTDTPADPAADAPREVDPWRFAGSFLKKVLGGQIPDAPFAGEIPWAVPNRPLGESRVALLSTAGLSMQTDVPFDMELERKNPMRGDPSWRRLPASATGDAIDANHLHIDTGYVKRDIDVALPVHRLAELADDGFVGSVADHHYSIMGFQGNDSSTLVEKSAPAIAEAMRNEEVDLALLAPV